MQHSKLPIRKWYMAMALMTFSKKPISAMELQRQLGHKYDTVWFLMHRIRKAMGQTDDVRTTLPTVDFDDINFKPDQHVFTDAEVEELRRLTELFWKNHENRPSEFSIPQHRGGSQWYFRMVPKRQLRIEKNTKSDETIITYSNKKSNRSKIPDYIDTMVIRECNVVFSPATRKWTGIVVGNFSRNIIGIFHQVKRKYLQSYLDEFCYKLNRRDSGGGLFGRLSLAIARSYW